MSPAFQHDRIRSGAGTPDPRLSRNAKNGPAPQKMRCGAAAFGDVVPRPGALPARPC